MINPQRLECTPTSCPENGALSYAHFGPQLSFGMDAGGVNYQLALLVHLEPTTAGLKFHSQDFTENEALASLREVVLPVIHCLLAEPADAEDAWQSFLCRLLENRLLTSDLKEDQKPLYRTIARNIARDMLRRRSRCHHPLDRHPKTEPISPEPAPWECLQRAELCRAVHKALAWLPAHYGLVIRLHHCDGLPIPVVAEATGRSVQVIDGWLKRGRRALSQLLADQVEHLL
jgi:RNA polymerase sigma factor (sigma-70 family)